MPNEVEEAKAVLLFAIIWIGGWMGLFFLLVELDYRFGWSRWEIWDNLFGWIG